MAVEDVQFDRGFPQIRQPTTCSFCHNIIDGRALYCDMCGHATLWSLELKKAALQSEIRELENAAQRVRISQTDIDALNDRLKELSDALQPLTVEVEELRAKKRELAAENDSLSAQIARQRQQLEQAKRPAARATKARPAGPERVVHHRGPKQVGHTFVCKYEGPGDWKAELSRLVTQFELSLDESTYSFSPQKIVFNVKGTKENVQRFAAALNSLEGFTNLRTKLANTKRSLQQSVEARNIHRQQLEALNAIPWYKRNGRNLAEQKTALEQAIAADDSQIKAISEDLRSTKELLASA